MCARLVDGTLLQGALVSVNLTAQTGLSQPMSQLINALGNTGTFSLEKLLAGELGDLAAIGTLASMAKLDESQCFAYTNENGRAKFHLKFLAGKAGTYTLVFASYGIRSDYTQFVYLTNEIASVRVLESSPQVLVPPHEMTSRSMTRPRRRGR